MAGSTIQAHSHFDGMGSKTETLIGAPTQSKGYQIMKAMGFKDRGASKYCFKSYEDQVSESDDEWAGAEPSEMLEHGILPKKRRLEGSRQKRYYTGPYTFKDNLNGIGYIPAPNELQVLRDGAVKGGEEDAKAKNRIKMSEFDDEDELAVIDRDTRRAMTIVEDEEPQRKLLAEAQK